jgi:PII-like signaling protein
MHTEKQSMELQNMKSQMIVKFCEVYVHKHRETQDRWVHSEMLEKEQPPTAACATVFKC